MKLRVTGRNFPRHGHANGCQVRLASPTLYWTSGSRAWMRSKLRSGRRMGSAGIRHSKHQAATAIVGGVQFPRAQVGNSRASTGSLIGRKTCCVRATRNDDAAPAKFATISFWRRLCAAMGVMPANETTPRNCSHLYRKPLAFCGEAHLNSMDTSTSLRRKPRII